jgi:hypothetical protein
MKATLKLNGGPCDGIEIKNWPIAPYHSRTIKAHDGSTKEHSYVVSQLLKDDNGNVHEAIGEYMGYSIWFFVTAKETRTHEMRLVPKEHKPDDPDQPAPDENDSAVS